MWKSTDFHKKFDLEDIIEVKEEKNKPPLRIKSKPISKKSTVSKPEKEPEKPEKPKAPEKTVSAPGISKEVEFVEIPEMILDESGKTSEEYKS